MTRLERYKERITRLEERCSLLLRSGKFAQAAMLRDDIEEAKQMLKEAEEYEEATKPRPVADILTQEQLDKLNLIPLMLECHLAADYLVEISYMIKDTCEKEGLCDVQFMPELQEILDRSDIFASFLTKMGPNLESLLTRNETFNASLHKKYQRYIEQRLAPRKKKES